MQKDPGFGWKCYLVFFAIMVVRNTIDLFSSASPVYLFYFVIVAFQKSLNIIYWVNVFTTVFNILCLIPLFLYVYRKRFLCPRVWQWVFVLRVIFDITGHTYQRVMLKSLFFSSPKFAAWAVVIFLLVLFPSYLACYQYAFQNEKIFPKQKTLF